MARLTFAGVVSLLAATAVLVLPEQAFADNVYVTNGNSSSGNSVSQYSVAAGGLLAPLSPPTIAASSPRLIAVSPNGGNVYVASVLGNSVAQFTVGPDGTLTSKTPVAVTAGNAPTGVAVSPDGRSVYVANNGDGFTPGSVSQYTVGSDGTLTPKLPASVPAGFGAYSVALSPDGSSAYVANVDDATVSQYDVTADGTLTAKSPAAVAAGPGAEQVIVSPDGGSVYVTNRDSFPNPSVSQYDVGSGGKLTAKSPATVSTGAGTATPQGIAITPDGSSVYVADTNSPTTNSIAQFTVGPGGKLVAKSPATVPLPMNWGPIGIAVSADGTSLYTANSSTANVGQFTIGAGGTLTAKSPATVAAGDNPTGVAVSPLAGGGGGTPPPVPGPASKPGASAAEQLLACAKRPLVLEDVIPRRTHVDLLGVADRRFVGKSVALVFTATGRVVAHARVGADGFFVAKAPLPPTRVRHSNRARYQARIGGERSLNLKLFRRMIVTSARSAHGLVAITGRVIPPLPLKPSDRVITLERLVTCSKAQDIARIAPRGNGSFRVTVPAPQGQSAAVYRLRTKIRVGPRTKRLGRTYTLPRAIDFK